MQEVMTPTWGCLTIQKHFEPLYQKETTEWHGQCFDAPNRERRIFYLKKAEA
jgi:hypothetical protein